MEDVEVRMYEKKDLEGVNKILGEAFSAKREDFEGEEFKEIVAVFDQKVVGYLLLTRVWNPIGKRIVYYVDYVCVDSEYRGHEIGRKLMDKAYEIAKENGAKYLQLTCSHFRVAAHKLYEKCNYVKRDSDIFRKEIL